MTFPSPPPTTLRLRPWPEDPRESRSALSPYCETYWAPILCPTAYVVGRRLAMLSLQHDVPAGGRFQVEVEFLARSMGVFHLLDESKVSLATMVRALKRLEKYHLVAFRGSNAQVRTVWPRLPAGLCASLPLSMQQAEPQVWEFGDVQVDRVGLS